MWALLLPLCLSRGLSLRYRREDVLRVLVAGFLSMGLYMFLFLEGLHKTSAAEGAIILATSPVWTYLMAAALKQETFRLKGFVGSCVAFLGVAVVIAGGAASDGSTLKGNLELLASAILWAFCVVYMKPLLKHYEATQLLTLSMPGGALLMVPYGIGSVMHLHFGAISLVGWLMFLQVAVLSGLVGFACFYVGIKQIGPSRTTLYQYFVPPTAVFFAWSILGKTLSPFQFLGFAVLLYGVVTTSRARISAEASSDLDREAAG